MRLITYNSCICTNLELVTDFLKKQHYKSIKGKNSVENKPLTPIKTEAYDN